MAVLPPRTSAAAVQVKEAFGKVHLDAAVADVEHDEEGLDVGDQDLVAVRGLDGEQGRGAFQAAGAVGVVGKSTPVTMPTGWPPA